MLDADLWADVRPELAPFGRILGAWSPPKLCSRRMTVGGLGPQAPGLSSILPIFMRDNRRP